MFAALGFLIGGGTTRLAGLPPTALQFGSASKGGLITASKKDKRTDVGVAGEIPSRACCNWNGGEDREAL
jgi:hypothetical protein